MNERNHSYSRWSPDELLTGAQQGFDLASAYVQHDADRIRDEAASVFELAAGELIFEALEAQGVTLDQLEQLTPEEMRCMVESLAPEIVRRIQDQIALLDGRAKNALENKRYDTLRRNGLTRND